MENSAEGERLYVFSLAKSMRSTEKIKAALTNLSQEPAKATTMAKHTTGKHDLPFICNKYTYINIYTHAHKNTNKYICHT